MAVAINIGSKFRFRRTKTNTRNHHANRISTNLLITSDLNSVTASTRTTMSSRPYESYGGSGGGGGFSGGGGGGFSGGGGGGGGGHSW